LIGSFFSWVVIVASIWKELLSCTEKIYIGGADVEAVLCFKNPIRSSPLLLPRLSSFLYSLRQ
jgi:hypothetical protein